VRQTVEAAIRANSARCDSDITNAAAVTIGTTQPTALPHRRTTRKALAAREFGTKTVEPTVFAVMVTYVQPATPTADTTGTPSGKATRPTRDLAAAAAKPTPGLSTVNPAEIRSWARQHGLPVGVRGRLPAEL